jgi:outer membrane receptor protein involved in Fe transport
MPVSKSRNLPQGLKRTPVATAVLLALASPALMAQETTTLGEVTVTAQKRTENIQNVPISLAALNTQALEELHVQNFKDYVQMLPTVSMQPSLGAGSGFSAVYMRGIASGGDGQATTSQPSVGMYLDEQPITTIQGNLDIHLYDIARVEALAGPQGTLYGASSQAGTIRIITNKPDPSGFSAGYSLEGNMVDGDDAGYVAEGFVNVPIGDRMAVRLVGWTLRDAGWIDNALGTRTYPGDQSTTADDFVVDNAAYAKKNYNTVDTAGARAALRIELNDNWTMTPVVQTQKQDQKGSWGDDLSTFLVGGTQDVMHFRKEFTNDKWYQAGLTIEGKIGNFDLVYSGNYLNRDVDGSFDYSDYSYWYDNLYTSGYFAGLFLDNDGNRVNPAQSFTNNDHYTKQSHELRISSSQDNRVRGLLGLFWQHQYHDFYQEFGNIVGLGDVMLMNSTVDVVNGNPSDTNVFPGVVYLNSMDRNDRDKAIFGQLAFDITDSLELTVGARFFEPEVTVKGFFGFGLGFSRSHAPGTVLPAEAGEPGAIANGGDGAYSTSGQAWSSNGEWRCAHQVDYKDAPCLNVDKGISESNHIGRVNLSWKATDTAMLYATWSEGYRPGGINRNPFAGDYVSDFLTNYEVGWKTRWMDDRLQFNGAVFQEKWDKFQVAFQGANGITQVNNGPSAEVNGLEAQIDWLPTDKLRLSTSMAFYDTKLKDDYCVGCNSDGSPWAPKGTELPVTARVKGNVVARYSFELGSFDAFWQGSLAYTGARPADLNVADNAITGDIPASKFVDFSFGVKKEAYSVELFVANVTDETAPLGKTSECATSVCGIQSYGIRARPRTVGIKFSQDF